MGNCLTGGAISTSSSGSGGGAFFGGCRVSAGSRSGALKVSCAGGPLNVDGAFWGKVGGSLNFGRAYLGKVGDSGKISVGTGSGGCFGKLFGSSLSNP